MGEIIGNYYSNLKEQEQVNRELMDSQITDDSTAEALKLLRPKCPLKL